MPSREENQASLDQMCQDFLQEVDAERFAGRKPPLPETSREIFRGLLNDPNGAHENLLQAIDEGNLQTLMTPIGPGQGMYSAPSRALCIAPETLDRIGDPAVAYNLNFTLAHECRHARDGAEIRDMTEQMRQQVFDKAQEAGLPHDYTGIVRDYLARDRVLEERAETTGLNAHVSKVVADMADHGRQATLRDVYESSPKDMAPYVDVTPGGLFGQPTYAYKPGFAPEGDGLHLQAGPATLDAMGRYFYDAQDYDWKQGLKGVLDVINQVEQSQDAVRSEQSPPGIDFAALGIGPPPDSMCRDTLQNVVNSSLPKPNEDLSPDRAYFDLLKSRLPGQSDEVVAHAVFKARQDGLNDPSRVVPDEVGVADNGKIWIGGDHGERIVVDPSEAPSLARTAQRLDNQASEHAQEQHQQQEPARKQSNCAVM